MNNLYKYSRSNFFFLILFFITLTIFARIIAKPHGPHGGMVKKTGEYYIEMKNADRKIVTYLLDKKMNTISNKDVKGEARLFFSDSTTFDIPLKPSGEDEFTCSIPMDFYACKITFTAYNNLIFAKFDNPVKMVINK